jgi:MIP family channel proteins
MPESQSRKDGHAPPGRITVLRRCVSEFLGTYLLVLVGPASVIALPQVHVTGPVALVLVAFAFGGIVVFDIMLFGTYSGAIVNPALTLSAYSARLLGGRLAVLYVVSQFAGGLTAGVTLKLIFGSTGDLTSIGSTKLVNGLGPILGIALEALGTFVLASSALIATTRIKKPAYQAFFVGLTLAILIILIGPLTGASFNPARSLGPALAAGYLSNLSVYFIGPIVGALSAGIILRVQTRVRHHPKSHFHDVSPRACRIGPIMGSGPSDPRKTSSE